jgi:LPS-assembly lipoprotein
MWWFSAAALVLSLAVAGCGYGPLYRRDAASNPLADLRAVDIPASNSRLVQEIRNNLLDLMSPEGRPEAPRYRLSVTANESQGSVLITRSDVVTRYNLTLAANYALHDAKTGAVLFSGAANSFAAYSVVRAEFASLAAERDARSRAAREVGEQIRARLAAYFARQIDAPPGALGAPDDTSRAASPPGGKAP